MLNQHPKILHLKNILIMKNVHHVNIRPPLLCWFGFESSTIKNLNSYNFCIQNSSKTYFSALITLSEANKTSKSFFSLII